MTENEAKEILEEVKVLDDSMYQYNTNYLNAIDIAIEAFEEIQQYRAIGTVEEIKKVVQFLSLDNDNGIIEDLQLLNKYQLIGTVEECREARERQIPKNYKKIQPCKSVTYYQCPCCNGLLHINENFCGECGQSIDWKDLD